MRLVGFAAIVALVGCGSTSASPSPGADAGLDATLDGAIDASNEAGDAAEDVRPRLGRTLGLDINAAEDGNYITSFNLARDAGVQAVNLTIDWSRVETVSDAGPDGGDAGGVMDFDPNLHIANLVFPGAAKVSLAFRAVDTTGPSLPSDLAGRPLDDAQVRQRYDAAQDYVFGQIPDLTLTMYVIGNELDLALGTDSAKWAAYRTFFDGAAAHARTLKPGVKVGSVFTLAGALAHPELVTPTLANADFLGLTYYPLRADFSVRPPTDVRADLDSLVALYPSVPIFFREAGYPSGADVASSAEQQAAFVTELFRAWDAHAERIPIMTLFTMNEYSPQAIASLAKYYGSSDPKFLAYLGTLGLRTYAPGSGANKPAWDALAHAAHARGW